MGIRKKLKKEVNKKEGINKFKKTTNNLARIFFYVLVPIKTFLKSAQALSL